MSGSYLIDFVDGNVGVSLLVDDDYRVNPF